MKAYAVLSIGELKALIAMAKKNSSIKPSDTSTITVHFKVHDDKERLMVGEHCQAQLDDDSQQAIWAVKPQQLRKARKPVDNDKVAVAIINRELEGNLAMIADSDYHGFRREGRTPVESLAAVLDEDESKAANMMEAFVGATPGHPPGLVEAAFNPPDEPSDGPLATVAGGETERKQ